MKCEVCGQEKHCVSIDVEWTLLDFVCEDCWEKECDKHYGRNSNSKKEIKITDKELAEFIAERLPISTEDAEYFIDAVQKGYNWGNINYAIAMSMRDKKIEELRKENQKFREVTSKYVVDHKNGISMLDIIISELD